MKTINVDGVEYRPVETSGLTRVIAIVDNRGLTLVGDMDMNDTSEWRTIYNARCVIRWGTAQHLAELVDGPLGNTRLGVAADALVRADNIVLIYRCGDGWDE